MPETLNCFPLTVYKDQLGLSEAYRREVGQKIIETSEANPLADGEDHRWTGDLQGHDLFHLDPLTANLFGLLKTSVTTYVFALGMDPARFQYHCTRSWGTVSLLGEHIPVHNHSQSHISAVYYPVKPEGAGNLILHNRNPPNEFAPGLFGAHASERGYVQELTDFNTMSATMAAAEDDLIIFPSKQLHGTEVSEADSPRISIAVDIVVTLKGESGGEYSMPDLTLWRDLETFD